MYAVGVQCKFFLLKYIDNPNIYKHILGNRTGSGDWLMYILILHTRWGNYSLQEYMQYGVGGKRTHMITELYRTSIKVSLNLYNPWGSVAPSLPVNHAEVLGTSSLTAFQSQFKDWALYQGHSKFYKESKSHQCDYQSCLPSFQVNNSQGQHSWYFTS